MFDVGCDVIVRRLSDKNSVYDIFYSWKIYNSRLCLRGTKISDMVANENLKRLHKFNKVNNNLK